jgi:selenocysteine lyase/cysteine desulfurase
MPLTRRQFLGTASATLVGSAVTRQAGAAEDDPLGVRNDFPALAEGLYLNAAYNTPIPTAVARAGCAFIEAKSRRPIPLPDMLAERDAARQKYARLVGADAAEIALLYATSDGENIVTRSLDVKAGDNIVIDDLHYTSSYVIYRQLEKRAGIEVRIARHQGGAAPPSIYEPLVDRRTRMVSVAWVSNVNGFRHDVKALADLAHAHGAYLYADAVQAVGMFPIDAHALGVDFFASGTYKWLLAGYGVAPFYVRRELLDRIQPDRWGEIQVAKNLGDFRYEIQQDGRKFEYATLGFEAVYQVSAALSYLERVGMARIEAHTVGLAARLRDGLVRSGFEVLTPAGNRASIVTFAIKSEMGAARRVFDDAKVQVTVRNGSVRVSPALYNTAAEIDRFVDVAGTLK